MMNRSNPSPDSLINPATQQVEADSAVINPATPIMGKYHDSHNYSYLVGRMNAHLFRRLVHISSLLIPIFYYYFQQQITQLIHVQPIWLIVGLLILLIIAEIIRLKFDLLIFGQRNYERRHLSAFAWGLGSLCIVLMLAPTPYYATAIIAGYAIVDPLLGELRRLRCPPIITILTAGITAIAVWLLCSFFFLSPPQPYLLYLAICMGPLTVLSEWPNLKWIDDNALMQLIPLSLILIVHLF